MDKEFNELKSQIQSNRKRLQRLEEQTKSIISKINKIEQNITLYSLEDISKLLEEHDREIRMLIYSNNKWDRRDALIERIKRLLTRHIAENAKEEAIRGLRLLVRIGIVIILGIIIGKVLKYFQMHEYAEIVNNLLQQ